MSDQKLRDLERRWRQTGSVEDEAAYLLERVRVGDLTQERLKLAGYCGHVAAQDAIRAVRPTLADGDLFDRLLRLGTSIEQGGWPLEGGRALLLGCVERAVDLLTVGGYPVHQSLLIKGSLDKETYDGLGSLGETEAVEPLRLLYVAAGTLGRLTQERKARHWHSDLIHAVQLLCGNLGTDAPGLVAGLQITSEVSPTSVVGVTLLQAGCRRATEWALGDG